MAAINPLAREVAFKIVFYGPGLGGKTTTLQYIHDVSQPERRGKMVSLATAVDRTLYFDFLPLRLPPVAGMQVRLQLFTVPGQVYYNATRKLVLNGADGIVFVADSQEVRGDANLESLENLRENLAEQNRSLVTVPHVLQFNKRDLPDVLSEEELNDTLNAHRAPSLGSVATSGEGVFESLEAITLAVIESFQHSRGVSPSAASTATGRFGEQGLIGALRRTERNPGAVATRTIAVVASNVLEPIRDRPSDAIPDMMSLSVPPVLSEVDEIAEPPTPLVPDAGLVAGASPPTLLTREDVIDEIEASVHHDPEPVIAAPMRPSPSSSPSTTQPGRAQLQPHVFSFAALWPDSEREQIRDVEQALAHRDFIAAVDQLDRLATRMLAGAAALLGAASAPRDPAIVPVLLGLDGARYLSFRRVVQESRADRIPDEAALLSAYMFVLELRQARARIGF